MKKLKLASLLAVIVLTSAALSACGKPSTATELIDKTVVALGEVESYSEDYSIEFGVEGMSFEMTGSAESTITPEPAYNMTFNIMDKSFDFIYVDDKIYVGGHEVPQGEVDTEEFEEMIDPVNAYNSLEEYIVQDSLSFVENEESYTLNLGLDLAAATEKIVEDVDPEEWQATWDSFTNTTEAPEGVEQAVWDEYVNFMNYVFPFTTSDASVPPAPQDVINVEQIDFQFEIDKKTYLPTSTSLTFVISLGSEENAVDLSYSISCFNVVFNAVEPITAPVTE